MLSYQLFRTAEETEEIAKQRQESLWKIFDAYYAQLPEKSKETENDKTWRLYLARMDRRKMNITTEEKGEQILINFNPEIDPELRQYSEGSLAKSSEAMKYMPLKLWSHSRFENRETESQQYPQYDKDRKRVVSDTKEIIEGLRNDDSQEKTFTLFYHSVPAYTCAVLIRDYFGDLTEQEKEFCKAIILDYASMAFRSGYHYQVGDGIDAAINVLPLFLKPFPEDRKNIKEILLFMLFNSYPTGMSQRLADYAASAICQHLWRESPEDANSMFRGYLLLKSKFDSTSEAVRKENWKTNEYGFSIGAILERLVIQCGAEISKVVSNQLTLKDIPDLTDVDPGTLANAFLLLPPSTTDDDHKKFVLDVCLILSKAIRNDDREERLDYALKHLFLEKLAYFILNSEKADIESYLKPFINDFDESRETADFFSEFILAEDKLNQYEAFWTVWNLFYPKIVELCKVQNRRRLSEGVVHNYLLAWPYWSRDAKEWHSLKDREKGFFKKVAEDIGAHPAVLYSISKLLNEIGRGFVSDGISWISDILQKNPDLASKELEVNTIYYLENLVRGYILRNRYKVRTTPQQRIKSWSS